MDSITIVWKRRSLMWGPIVTMMTGISTVTATVCEYSRTLIDCDDTLADVNQMAKKPNGLDDNCNGTVDETTVVYDDDEADTAIRRCVNTFRTESDCDDGNHLVFPTAGEVCGAS